MSKQLLGGIHNVLDGLLSAAEPQPVQSDAKSPKLVEKPHVKIAKTPAAKTPPPAKISTARRGRPLGKATMAEPKTKVTLWLSQSLVDSYRDWSWEARCQFSHLVERALVGYQESQRRPKKF